MIRFCQLFTTLTQRRANSTGCIWYDFVSYSQPVSPAVDTFFGCIWYDFVSYSQLDERRFLDAFSCIWYDFVSYSQLRPHLNVLDIVVYDTIFSYFKERRCKDKQFIWINKILASFCSPLKLTALQTPYDVLRSRPSYRKNTKAHERITGTVPLIIFQQKLWWSEKESLPL